MILAIEYLLGISGCCVFHAQLVRVISTLATGFVYAKAPMSPPVMPGCGAIGCKEHEGQATHNCPQF